MINVSPEFLTIQKSNQFRPVRKVELSRRLADGSGWEVTPIDVTDEVVEGLDRLSWKLDSDNLNEFKSSNIRILFENSENQWDEGSSARFSGFSRYFSRIQIFLGLEVNGSDETFAVFTGVITDINSESVGPTVQATVQSLDALLKTTNAEPAGIVVQDELLGIGDGVQSEFLTSQNAVGVVSEIRLGGQKIRPGLRYSQSDLNEKNKPGKITFISSQPAPGEEVRADYIAWKTDQPIEQVVADVMALVPDVPIDQIDNVTFDPPVETEILHTLTDDFNLYDLRNAAVQDEPAPPQDDGLITINGFDTKAKWETGSSVDLNFTRLTDGITPEWTARYEGDRPPPDEKLEIDGVAPQPWVEQFNQSSSSVANGILTVSLPNSSLSTYVLYNQAETPTNGRQISARIKVNSITGTIHIGSVQSLINIGARMSIISTSQVQIESGGNIFGPYNVDLTNFRNLRLVMNTSPATTWQFYVDNSLVASGGIGTGPLAPIVGGVFVDVLTTANTNFQIDFLRFNTLNAGFPLATWETQIDYEVYLAGLTTFSLITTLGPFFADIQGAAANANFFFSWSSDGVNFTSEVSVTNGSTNLGSFTNVDTPRYIKFRIEVTGDEDPVISGVKRLFLPALAVSTVIDAGDGVEEFLKWEGTFVTNDGAVGRFTAGDSNPNFSYYQALGPSNEILSDDFALTNFGVTITKVILVTLLSTAGPNLPILRENRVTFSTRTLLVSQAVLQGKTVWGMITDLAQVADFEVGLKGDGSFFFRDKTIPPSSVLTLDASNIVVANQLSPGWERVFNIIRASHGNFRVEITPTTQGDPTPTSTERFRERILSLSIPNLIFDADVDLATNQAIRYYDRLKEPKRRLTLIASYLPQFELRDRVTVSLSIPDRISINFDAILLGVAHRDKDRRTEFDLQEVA